LTTLAPHIAWVFWLDADIIETPPTIIEDLTRHNRDVLVANAYQKYHDDNGQEQERGYDFNSWIDSETALNLAAKMNDEEVLFEGSLLETLLIPGYAEMATYRALMAHLRNPGNDVHEELQLDGVGTYFHLVPS
jgi:mannan polymerase complexes MNN9 subunit